jgi:metallo-beta-lactamase class B
MQRCARRHIVTGILISLFEVNNAMRSVLSFCLAALASGGASAASIDCPMCTAWNKDQAPFQIFGNTYYVGTHGLSSVLVTSPQGHILIDAALPQSAPLIAAHIEKLGFKVTDVKVILNSHVHFDHAGGIAEMQKMSGAKVMASDIAAPVLSSGKVQPNDPQFGLLPAMPPTNNVQPLRDQRSVAVGPLVLNVIHTPGHTPGGTTWTWKSCEGQRCLDVVYGDSLNAISDESFKYTGDARYPTARTDMAASIAAIEAAPCDVLVAAHPDLAGLWTVIDAQGKGDREKLIDSSACKRYASAGKARFEQRLKSEK